MSPTRLLAAALLAAVCAAPALAQSANPGEQLIAPYPSSWQRFPLDSKNPNVQMIRLLPPGETPDQFSEAIVVERFIGSQQTAKDFVGTMLDLGKKTCEGFLAAPATETVINGYHAEVARYGCTKGAHTGKSGVIMVLAVNGRDALHVIQSMWLGQPVAATQPIPIPDDVIRRWDVFASHVVLCDTRDPKHPCPAAQ